MVRGIRAVGKGVAWAGMLVVLLLVAGCGSSEPEAQAPPLAPPRPDPVPTLTPGRVIETPHTAILGMDVDSGGTRALTGGQGTNDAILWDLQSGKELLRLQGHTAPVTSVAMDAEGRRGITASRDRTVRVWDLHTGKLLHTLRGHEWPVLGVAISSDGKLGYSASDGFILWDLDTGQQLERGHGHTKTVWSGAFSDDASRLYTGSWDETMRTWSLPGLEPQKVFRGHNDRVKDIAVSQDESFAVTANTGDGDVRVWDPREGRLIGKLRGHPEGTLSVAISPDARFIASGSGRIRPDGSYDTTLEDSSIRLWDVQTGRQLGKVEGHGPMNTSLVFSQESDGLLSAGGDGKLRYWAIVEKIPDAPAEPAHGDGTGSSFLRDAAQ